MDKAMARTTGIHTTELIDNPDRGPSPHRLLVRWGHSTPHARRRQYGSVALQVALGAASSPLVPLSVEPDDHRGELQVVGGKVRVVQRGHKQAYLPRVACQPYGTVIGDCLKKFPTAKLMSAMATPQSLLKSVLGL